MLNDVFTNIDTIYSLCLIKLTDSKWTIECQTMMWIFSKGTSNCRFRVHNCWTAQYLVNCPIFGLDYRSKFEYIVNNYCIHLLHLKVNRFHYDIQYFIVRANKCRISTTIINVSSMDLHQSTQYFHDKIEYC